MGDGEQWVFFMIVVKKFWEILYNRKEEKIMMKKVMGK